MDILKHPKQFLDSKLIWESLNWVEGQEQKVSNSMYSLLTTAG